MAINPSGPVSLGGATAGQSINLENAQPATSLVTLNDTPVRSLAGVTTPASIITMPTDFWGKSNVFAFTLAAGTDVNLRTQALAAGWPGSGAVQATINPGTTIQASSTSAYALTINGSWPGGVTLINNGEVKGRGGNGGNGGNAPAPGTTPGIAGLIGGPALLVSSAVTINNAGGGIRGGGGGGGGGGAARRAIRNLSQASGSGGGGGIGVSTGGTAGVASGGLSIENGNPGGAGTISSFGTGGAGTPGASGNYGGAGGNGGSYGSSGNPGNNGSAVFPGGSASPGNVGGGAGTAVNGYSLVTWISTGTINGPTSG
jgi:hypothetical protein